MAFSLKKHKDQFFTVTITIKNADGSIADSYSYRLAVLSYSRWNEIGLQVVTEVAAKIRDPEADPADNKYIVDKEGQRLLNSQAETLRNAMRIVASLEGGEGIEWGDDEPDTLEEKAELFQDLDPVIFVGLLSGVRNRAFGGSVTIESAAERFPSVSDDIVTSNSDV